MRNRWMEFLRELSNRWRPVSAPPKHARGEQGTKTLRIPLWKGFNLPDLYMGQPSRRFRESDFAQIAAWGFNFVRLPLSYRTWASADDPLRIREADLRPIDQAVSWAERYDLHVNLCMHRIPGYCINPDQQEPFELFGTSAGGRERALEAAAFHWHYFAERYRGVANSRLSFDLLNEPPWMRDSRPYEAVVLALVQAIREVDAERLIFADGIDIGQTPLWGLAEEGLVQSTRGYLPKRVTHHEADWVPAHEFEGPGLPAWPWRGKDETLWDKDRLRAELIVNWKALADRGVPVHVGEWGCFSATPHDVTLAWMEDMLSLWKEVGWGWALWNFRGSFGVLDSGRKDVRYEKLGKHLLDRRMLELLRAG